LIPASPWLDDTSPDRPWVDARRTVGGIDVLWGSRGSDPAFLWVVYTRAKGVWTHRVLAGGENRLSLPDGRGEIDAVAVSAVDRLRNEGGRERITLRSP
jgi:hypothetical protein